MARNSLADFLRKARTLSVAVEANVEELAHVEEDRRQLESEVDETEEASVRQNLYGAQFHQATRDVEEHRAKANELVVRISNALRARYGLAAEKLAEFGLQPRRFSRSKPKVETPPQPGPTPPEAAAPAADGTT